MTFSGGDNSHARMGAADERENRGIYVTENTN
jgi:hypothetical protein